MIGEKLIMHMLNCYKLDNHFILADGMVQDYFNDTELMSLASWSQTHHLLA